MKSSKSGKPLVSDEVMVRMFLKKLYEERMLSNDEYVIATKLINEKYPTNRKQ